MRTSWHIAKVGLALLVRLAPLVCATYSAPALAATPSAELANARSQAIAEYFQGRHVSAVKALRQAATAKRDSLPPQEVRATYDLLVDMCTTLRDALCLFEAGDAIRKVVPHPLSTADDSYLLFIVTLATHFANQLPPQAVDFMEKVGPQNIDPVTQPLLYVNFSLLAADILVAKGRSAAAAIWLDAALSVLLAHGQFGDYYTATALVRSMALMTALGQHARADYYWKISESYLRTALPLGSAEALDFYHVVYRDAEHVGHKGLVERSARDGLELLGKVELPAHLADWYRESFSSGAAATCAIAADLACADFFLAQHPLAGKEDQLLTVDGSFRSERAAQFALISTLRRAFGNQDLNQSWRPAFAKLATAVAPTDQPEVRAHATWVLGLYEFASRPPNSDVARTYFIDAARLRLRDIGVVLNRSPTGFWLPDSYDRVILASAAVSVASKDASTVEERQLAVQAIEVGNRTLRHFGVDSFSAAAAATDQERQHDTRALTQLLVRFGAWEKQRLLALFGEGGAKVRADPEQLKNSGKLRMQYIGFVEQITELAQRLPAGARAVVPNVNWVQSLLRPGEVAVTSGSLAGTTAFACIRNDRIDMARVRIGDPEQIKEAHVDLRVLNAAFTDDRAPSAQLDSQFPFANAQRVYRWMFEPLQSSCAKRGERVIWVDASTNTFPVHALSANVPPGKDGFYDLSKAAWLGRDFAFSYVISLSHFVGARRESARANFGTGYLGVGNPNLSGMTADGKTTFAERIATRSSRSATAGLVSLSQLPETEQEIRGLSKRFGMANATVLLGRDATEANVRRQLLSEYGVIHFATHGVIGEELPGLTEPALVVTPVSEASSANDGLLTATEISQLTLHARLVVLSACNTANFSVSLFGNEFQGLSTAFLLSGSPTMMLTLWPVDSATSETVVGAAIAAARDTGIPVDKALSGALLIQATASGNKAYLHPRFWAPFMIFGDGSVTLAEQSASSAARPRFRLRVFDEFKDGGDLFSIVRVPQSPDVLVSGYADLENARFKSLLQRVAPDGSVKWRRQDATVAGGLLISWGSAVLAAGQISEGDHTRGVLSRYSFEGDLLWRVRISPEEDASVVAMVDRGKEADVVAVSPRLTGLKRTGARLLRIDSNGSVRKVIVLPVPSESDAQTAVAFVEGNTTVVLLSLSEPFTGRRSRRDRFSQNVYCQGEHGVIRVVVSNETDQVLASGYIRGVNYHATAEADGRRYLAADDYDPCAHRSVAGILEFNLDDQLKPVYRGEVGASTQLRTLDTASPRRLVALGSSELKIDPASAPHFQGMPSPDDLLAPQSDRVARWFLLDIDPISRRSTTYFFSTGSTAWFVASTVVDSELVATGSVGGYPAVLRVRLPTRLEAP